MMTSPNAEFHSRLMASIHHACLNSWARGKAGISIGECSDADTCIAEAATQGILIECLIKVLNLFSQFMEDLGHGGAIAQMIHPDLKPAVHATALKLRCATATKITVALKQRWPRIYITNVVRYYLERLVAEGNLHKERVGNDVFYLSEESPHGNR